MFLKESDRVWDRLREQLPNSRRLFTVITGESSGFPSDWAHGSWAEHGGWSATQGHAEQKHSSHEDSEVKYISQNKTDKKL